MSAFCCRMRERYVLGIVGENPRVETPVEAADFIDFDAEHPDGKCVVKIKFCPFCGKPVEGPLRVQG